MTTESSGRTLAVASTPNLVCLLAGWFLAPLILLSLNILEKLASSRINDRNI